MILLAYTMYYTDAFDLGARSFCGWSGGAYELFYTVLYYILYCTVLYCTVLYFIVLYCTVYVFPQLFLEEESGIVGRSVGIIWSKGKTSEKNCSIRSFT